VCKLRGCLLATIDWIKLLSSLPLGFLLCNHRPLSSDGNLLFRSLRDFIIKCMFKLYSWNVFFNSSHQLFKLSSGHISGLDGGGRMYQLHRGEIPNIDGLNDVLQLHHGDLLYFELLGLH